jgi:hypothetical protein
MNEFIDFLTLFLCVVKLMINFQNKGKLLTQHVHESGKLNNLA